LNHVLLNLKIILIVVVVSFQSLKAQELFWVKTIDSGARSSYNWIKSSANKNYLYAVGNYSSFNKAIYFDSSSINVSEISKYDKQNFIIKIDTSGKVLFAKKIFNINSNLLQVNNFYIDKYDNLYLNIKVRDSLLVFDNTNKILFKNKFKNFIIKLDKYGDFIYQKQVEFNTTVLKLLFNEDYFYLVSTFSPDSLYVFNNDTLTNVNIGVVKYDTNFTIIKAFALFKNDNSYKVNDQSLTLTCDALISNNQLTFLSLISLNYPKNLNVLPQLFLKDTVIQLKTFNHHSFVDGNYLGGNLIQMNFDLESLRLKDYFFLSNKSVYSDFSKITISSPSKGKFIAVLNTFDTTELFNNIIINENVVLKKPETQQIFIYYSDSVVYRMYTKRNNSYNDSMVNFYFIHNGFLYVNYHNNNSKFNFIKIDSLNNILVHGYVPFNIGNSFNNFTELSLVAKDKWNGIYFFSNWDRDIEQRIDSTSPYWKHYQKTKNSDRPLLFKLWDFSITRGVVSKGPYCAGDTFLIPYAKDGQFQAQNEFIAELSDENGDFEGNHRTLGRLQTNKDSVIKGVLPLFDVVTSSKYRIRIISTHPPIQSYYRYDSLRLLIYSKDTAHAGNDTTVCYGSNTQLKTSGGSLWRWSPGSLVEDSTQRITQTKPIRQATQFRIIISDSSGCGKTDTTYKWVYPKTKITIHNTDTLVCKGSALLAMQVSGGNGNSFSYQWQTSNGLVLSNQQSFIYQDTFAKLVLIASDGCSENDTQLIQIKFYDSVKIQLFLANQQCKTLPFVLKPPVVGGKGEYSYFWNNSNTAQSDSIIINAYGTVTYKLKVKDICPNYQDSLSFEYTIAEPLDYQIPNDTQLCYGNSLSIVPQIIKGQRTSLYYFYIKENQTIKDSLIGFQLLNKTFTESSSIDIRVKDACNQWIEKTINIDVLKPISFQGVNDTLVCNNQWFNLQATTLGGKSPKIIMKNNNGVVLKSAYFIDTVIFVNAPFTLQFESQDGCTNPQIQKVMQIKVTDSLKFKVEQSPLCFKDTVSLNANVRGGKPYLYGYSWMNEQGNMINLSDKSILFSSLNKPQKLIASVKNECGTIVDTLSILPQTLAMFSVNEKVQCFYNQNFEFINNSQSNGFSTYLWRFPNSFIAQQNSQFELKGVYSDSGLFETSLLAISKGVCKDSFSLMTEVKPKPTVKMEWQRTTNSYDYSEWRFTAQSNQTLQNYEWKINDLPPQNGNPIFVPFTNTGKVYAKVKVLDSYGCWTEISDSFMMVHRMRFYIPNAVTINNDGVNESFFIPGSEFMRTYHIEIYNRWGERVFESNNPNETFSPAYKGSDVYIYKLNIFDIYNERHLINGVFGVYR
jgi:hypothetical protein